jgi:hypothetical protein
MIYVGVILAILVVAAAIEIVARRLHGIPVLSSEVSRKAHSRHAFFKDNMLIKYHRRLGWTLTPNMRAEVQGMSTDAMGNRLPSSTPRDLPVGTIVVCGNSFAAGADVHDHESFPALLEAKLGTPVVNASSGGWGADQALMRAEEMLTLARPKTLIVNLFGFDFQRAEFSTYHYARKAYYVLKGDGLELKDCPVPIFNDIPEPIVDQSYAIFLAMQWLRRKRGIEPALYHRSSAEGSGLEITKRLIRQLKAQADRQGTRLIMLMQYAGGELVDLDAQSGEVVDFVKFLRANGITTIDTWEQWRQILKRDPDGFRSLFRQIPDSTTLGHLQASGNRLIADAAAAAFAPSGAG